MKTLLYQMSLFLTLPGLLASVACFALEHIKVTRNPLQLAYDLLVGFVWSVPVGLSALIILCALGFFDASRIWGIAILAVLNLTALVTIVLFVPTRALSDLWVLMIPAAALGIGAFLATGDFNRLAAPSSAARTIEHRS